MHKVYCPNCGGTSTTKAIQRRPVTANSIIYQPIYRVDGKETRDK